MEVGGRESYEGKMEQGTEQGKKGGISASNGDQRECEDIRAEEGKKIIRNHFHPPVNPKGTRENHRGEKKNTEGYIETKRKSLVKRKM